MILKVAIERENLSTEAYIESASIVSYSGIYDSKIDKYFTEIVTINDDHYLILGNVNEIIEAKGYISTFTRLVDMTPSGLKFILEAYRTAQENIEAMNKEKPKLGRQG